MLMWYTGRECGDPQLRCLAQDQFNHVNLRVFYQYTILSFHSLYLSNQAGVLFQDLSFECIILSNNLNDLCMCLYISVIVHTVCMGDCLPNKHCLNTYCLLSEFSLPRTGVFNIKYLWQNYYYDNF